MAANLAIEAKDLFKAFDGKTAVDGIDIAVPEGSIYGILGPNGAGKTTLLRVLLGDLPPDEGEVRHGANVRIAYYDQQRERLDPDRTVFDTIGEGNDTVTANGRTRHVNANPIVDIDEAAGTATVRSTYVVLQATAKLPFQPIVGGRYEDRGGGNRW